MTSSSEPLPWSPLDLDAATTPVAPAFAGMFVTAPPEPGDAHAWLPALRRDSEMEGEAVLRVQLEDAFRRGADEASLMERAHAEASCASALQAVAGVASQLEALVAEFARDRERDLQAAAIAVARHVVQHELTIDPLRVGELVRRSLELLPQDHSIEVRMHPEDLRTLGASLEGLLPEGRRVHLQWMSDASLERGGFVIETPHRIVDGRSDVALRTLYDRFEHD